MMFLIYANLRKKNDFSNGFVRKETIFLHFSLVNYKVHILRCLQLYYFCGQETNNFLL